MKNWIVKLAIGLGLMILLLATGLLYIANGQAMAIIHNYPADREPPDETPADYGHDYETVELVSADGTRLSAWYIPSKNGAAVMAQHGFKSDKSRMLREADILARHDFGVLILDVRAHGESEGEVISFGYYEMADLDAGFAYLTSRPDVDPARIGMIGLSMGGSMVLQYAAQNTQIQAVLSHSPFSSLEDTIITGVETFTDVPAGIFAGPIRFFAERELGVSASEISAVSVVDQISPRPVFILHGGGDTVVGGQAGQKVYDAALEPKELWFHPEWGHVPFGRELPEVYEARVVAFFDQYLLDQ